MSRSDSARFDPDRLDAALRLDEPNKPDSKPLPDLGSPVSPLRPRGPAPATSGSSGSSGSFSSKPPSSSSAAAAASSGRRSHSGELPGGGGGGGGGGSTASSPATNVLPAGNICPSGKIAKMGAAAPRSDVLGSGTGHYGHGSIMWGGSASASASAAATSGDSPSSSSKRAPTAATLQDVIKVGNEHYKKGNYAEALRLYDRAVAMCPDSASCRSNRAAALVGLGRLCDAAKECEEALQLDPANTRAHHRLASVNLRLGLIANARRHISLAGPGQQPNPSEWKKMQEVERHLGRCEDSRKAGDWKSALREADAAIAAGADSSPLLLASRAEALLRLHKLEEADSSLSKAPKLENSSSSSSSSKFSGMLSNSYIYIVQAQVDMALGRFESAVTAAEKARQVDPGNIEISMAANNVRLVARARAHGNELFKSGNFAEACIAYGEGLKYDSYNPVLYCNRAACRFKLGQWEKSVEDCNEALRIQPSYTKALLRRAASYTKLERWVESVRDYEVLRKELPEDTEVAEALFHAQVALKTSRGEEVSNMKFGGEVEDVTSVEQFQAEISFPGVSVVYFTAASNQQCTQISPFVDALCKRYPSANFLKVDINQSPLVARAENVRIVPTFKIYKNGARMKEMICPNQQVLEYSVRHYSL
ncbi:TPR repeat-containing thioredoxin TTL1-like [Ananas comosus]|uniref:TPR repeat-containing thioredoxin TTL1 n=1 Tax=Ananas comosus TaxID=4615 RepID=A0A199VIK0_ANACO|nr:TPR repeat-containing thioredoxin TTL1-like [Ananas comosus]OAY76833.1 TPR repeat-containing thioredoxin TTL1 [Ananas comosus]